MQNEQLAVEVRSYPTLYDKPDKVDKKIIFNILFELGLSTKSMKNAPQGYVFLCFLENFQKSPLLAKSF